MKKTSKIIAGFLALNFVHQASGSDLKDHDDWSRKFTYNNGFELLRTPECIILGGMLCCEEYKFSAGSSINNLVALQSGTLSVKQSFNEFRNEAQKLGTLISEK